jgi:hypothetical protein
MRVKVRLRILLIVVCGAGCTGGLPDRPEAHQPFAAMPASALDAAAPAANGAVANAPPDASVALQSASSEPPPVAPGYQRFVASPVDVPMGSSDDWAQWVGGPLDQDYDVVDITGWQSVGGHHAILYATPDANPPGTTRLWRDADQLTTRIMGGVGGEGGANARLPPGVVFRVKKGKYLLMQTHFLNVQPRTLVGRSVLDVKLEPVDRSRRVASILSSTVLKVNVLASGKTSVDVTCPVQADVQFIQIANHMHDYGQSAFTEYTDPAGQLHMLKRDDAWSGEWALNPNFTHFPVEAPAVIPKGSVIHTRCNFANQTAKEVAFPAEMCVFFGFILSEVDIYCTDGKWSIASSSDEPVQPAGDAGISDAGPAADAGPGGCLDSNDQAIMKAATFDQRSTDCSVPCAFDTDVASCTARCFQRDVGLSASCARCNGVNVACGAKNCFTDCLTDSASPACRSCVSTNCDPAFHMCTGT